MPETNSLRQPRLRPVEAFPVRMKEQEYFCVRDPETLALKNGVRP